MSASTIYESAPLGALIRYSDGALKPPARFKKKLAAWERTNGVGRLIRKTPAFARGAYVSPAAITLHEGDFASGGVVVLVVHRTYGLDSPLRFDVLELPKLGSWRVVRPFGEAIELIHLAADRAAAEAWRRENRYSDARIEPVDVGDAARTWTAPSIDSAPVIERRP